MAVVIGIIVFLLVVGSLIAIAWWHLSAKAAPYADEDARRRARREREMEEEADATVVLDESGRPVSRAGGARGDDHARRMGAAAGMMGAVHAHGMPDPSTTPVEREDGGSTGHSHGHGDAAGGTMYSGPDADTTGFGGGGSSYDGGGFDGGGSMDSGSGSDSTFA